MTIKHGLLAALGAVMVAFVPATSTAEAPIARAAATCASYLSQVAAQEAADTRDLDGANLSSRVVAIVGPR